MTVEQVLARWAKVSARSEFTQIRYNAAARSLASFGILTPEQARRELVAEYVQFRLLFVEPGTINSELAALSTVLSFLERSSSEGDRAVFEKLRAGVRSQLIKVRKPRRMTARHLTRPQVTTLCEAARERCPDLVAPIHVGAYAGLRVRELCRIRWEDLELGARPQVRVRVLEELGRDGQVKTGNERDVPMCVELKRALVDLQTRRESRYLFVPRVDILGKHSGRVCANPHTLRLQLKRVGESVGIERATWNLLRHTRASWWVQAGVSIAKVAHWLGHTVATCEQFYAGLVDGYDPDCERMPA